MSHQNKDLKDLLRQATQATMNRPYTKERIAEALTLDQKEDEMKQLIASLNMVRAIIQELIPDLEYELQNIKLFSIVPDVANNVIEKSAIVKCADLLKMHDYFAQRMTAQMYNKAVVDVKLKPAKYVVDYNDAPKNVQVALRKKYLSPLEENIIETWLAQQFVDMPVVDENKPITIKNIPE